jgi:hypothetical protein
MKVLSWDVGIKNLSYCMINIGDDWKIEKWDIINLIKDDEYKCHMCSRKPYFSANNILYCKIHSKKYSFNPINIIDYFTYCEKETCCYVGKNKCNKNAKYKYSDYFYCSAHRKSIYNQYLTLNKMNKLSKKKNCMNSSIDVIRLKLINSLDNIPELLKANIVLIENQPSLKNPRMKAISSTIYDYFLIRGIVDKKINNSNINLVKYMCPSNKLKLVENNDKVELVKLKGNESKTYKMTKSLAVSYTKKLIKGTDWEKHLEKYKKKDDMADSFLQGMYYYNNVIK